MSPYAMYRAFSSCLMLHYICLFTYKHTHIERFYELFILFSWSVIFFHCTVAPSVSLAAGQIATTEPEAGNNVILSVNITRFNRPLTSINWSHSGNVLTDGVDRITINSSTLDSPPVISTLQRSSLIPLDFGPYLVNVTNEVGSDTFTFDVEVPGIVLV